MLLSYTVIRFFYESDMQQLTITYLILPLAAYLTGYYLVKTDKGGQIYNKVILYTAFGLFAYGILNIFQRYSAGYNLIWWVAAGRMCMDFWTGVDVWPTLEATYFLPLCSLIFYVLIIQRNLLLKLLYLAAFIISVWAALDIGSRANIALPLAMSLVLLFGYYRSSKILQSKKAALFIKLIMVVFIAAILYRSNVAGIKDTIESSNLYSRMTGQTYDSVGGFLELNGREVRYNIIFREMPTHLFGGIDLGGDISAGGLGSAHNTWLDIYRLAGIIPCALFIICTIMLITRMSCIIQSCTIYKEAVMPLMSVLIAINLLFLTESIFSLNTQLLNFYFMLCGMTDCIFLTLRMKPDNLMFDGHIKEKPLLGLYFGRILNYGQSKAS